MKIKPSLAILLGVFGVYFTGYICTYTVYGYVHKIKHPSPFWTIMSSEKKPCAKVLEYATYVSSVYASPLLLASDTASDVSGIYVHLTTPGFAKFGIGSTCVLLFHKMITSYEIFHMGGGFKYALLQFFDFLSIIEASASFSEGYLHYLFIWIAYKEGLLEAMPQMLITLISIAPYERRKQLRDTDFYVLIFSAIFSYAQVVLKIYKNDEGSISNSDRNSESAHDTGLVKYGRLALRCFEILCTSLLIVLLTYWDYLICMLFVYVIAILSLYGYFWFCVRQDEKLDEMALLVWPRNEKILNLKADDETIYVDRLILTGGDITNIFTSIICNPLLIPTRFAVVDDVDALVEPFFYAGHLPSILMNLPFFFPKYSFAKMEFRSGGITCQISTSWYKWKNEDEEICYLPFNLALYTLRGMLQLVCWMSIVVSVLISGISAGDEVWIHFSLGAILACIFAELTILFGIEYAFQKPCGSTFNATVAIMTKNSRMAKELLYLNQSPSLKVNNETLVSIALKDQSGKFPFSLLEIILKNGFDANQRIRVYEEFDAAEGNQSMIMLFLANGNEDCVRHLWKVQDLEVDATDRRGHGLFHYSLTHNLDFLQFMLHTMKVPFDSKEESNKDVLFGAKDYQGIPWILDRNDIKEDVLDWLIDECGADCSTKSYDGDYNILNYYILYGEVKLDRVKYWIEKREVDPWMEDAHPRFPAGHFRTAFSLIAELNDAGQITTEVRDYFASLAKSRPAHIVAPGDTLPEFQFSSK